MLEHVAQLGPMLIVAALIIGWTAEAVSHAGGYGLIPDMGVGLAGSALFGAILWTVVPGDPSMLVMFLIGCAGAMLALVGQRGLWRSTRARP